MAAVESDMERRLSIFSSVLSSFASSPDNFRVVSSIPRYAFIPAPSTLYVLDSSFNPPTLAHLRIATSALLNDHGPAPKRLLLLLATNNADKAPKPASFEQRLVLMTIFAQDLLKAYQSHDPLNKNSTPSDGSQKVEQTTTTENQIVVDLGITKYPYFVDKADAITASNIYPTNAAQVHLIGFDTLIRILNPKYYPPTHTLAPLGPFLARHRLRVTYRTGSDWGDREKQDNYLKAISDGEMEAKGGKREWRESIELVEGMADGEEVVSSTRARDAVKGNSSMLRKIVTEGVAEWVLRESLYLGD